jgi:uroporphyrinogen III methyltransferase/synthase
VRGAEALRSADVVIHDRLSEVSLLALAPDTAERIDVGKSPGAPIPQDEINRLLIDRARAGNEVVRLKGGDPFVFGRGGEEAQALLDAGIAFEVVPGITSAVAVPAYAGIPLTHRGLSTSFTVVTGHSRHSLDADIDWRAVAHTGGTIVVLMGVAHRAEIASRLLAAGMVGDTPVAAIRWGTRPDQRTARTTLARLPEVKLEPPVTIVIGAVAALDLAWFEARPLFGRRIVVTRAFEQASGLVEQLRRLGAEVVMLPTIEIAEPADGAAALGASAARVAEYDWVVFTSANAVERFFVFLGDARDFRAARVAAIGPGTAGALARRGIAADLVPSGSLAESLVDDFPAGPGRVLLPQAAAARDVLSEGLRAKGWDVTVVEAYTTRPTTPSPDALAAAATSDAIAFTSSSTVTNYLDVAGAHDVPPVVACIGPVTATTARERGLEVTVEASDHTVEGLVAALIMALGPV